MHQLVLIKSHCDKYAQQYEQKLGEEILLSLILNWKCKVYVQILSAPEIVLYRLGLLKQKLTLNMHWIKFLRIIQNNKLNIYIYIYFYCFVQHFPHVKLTCSVIQLLCQNKIYACKVWVTPMDILNNLYTNCTLKCQFWTHAWVIHLSKHIYAFLCI